MRGIHTGDLQEAHGHLDCDLRGRIPGRSVELVCKLLSAAQDGETGGEGEEEGIHELAGRGTRYQQAFEAKTTAKERADSAWQCK